MGPVRQARPQQQAQGGQFMLVESHLADITDYPAQAAHRLIERRRQLCVVRPLTLGEAGRQQHQQAGEDQHRRTLPAREE
ncbi:hypothetical protein D9M71_744740 [compost metagenome]